MLDFLQEATVFLPNLFVKVMNYLYLSDNIDLGIVGHDDALFIRFYVKIVITSVIMLTVNYVFNNILAKYEVIDKDQALVNGLIPMVVGVWAIVPIFGGLMAFFIYAIFLVLLFCVVPFLCVASVVILYKIVNNKIINKRPYLIYQ